MPEIPLPRGLLICVPRLAITRQNCCQSCCLALLFSWLFFSSAVQLPQSEPPQTAVVPTEAELRLPCCPHLQYSQCHRHSPWPDMVLGSFQPCCQDTATRISAVLDLIPSVPPVWNQL